MIAGQRFKVRAAGGASVIDGPAPLPRERQFLPEGAIVVAAEFAPAAAGEPRIRIASPAGWLRASDLEPTEPARSIRLDFNSFLERQGEILPGDHYGIPFPFTLDGVREHGAQFLTEAFHASGVLSPDNRVTSVEIQRLALQGASENGFLTVTYARPEPHLQTELFIKVPPAEPVYKFSLTAMSHGEIEMMRLSRTGILPVQVAKYYFGDFCSQSSNYILITGRVAFGSPPIEPAYRKGYDYLIPDIEGHYRALTRAQALLVTSHKLGLLGPHIEETFPFARGARTFDPIPDAEEKIDTLIDFVSRVAPHLFIESAAHPAFLKRWREDLLYGLEHKDAVIGYLHSKVDYTGLCHPNLNPDNAWYWRDEAGVLQVGLLDWGGVGQMSIAQALSGMLMMPEPHLYVKLTHDVIRNFISDYRAATGIALDPDEFLLQYRASLFSTAICTMLSVLVNHFGRYSESDYKAFESRHDPRLAEGGFRAAIVWIDNILRDWQEPLTPGDACRRIMERLG